MSNFFDVKNLERQNFLTLKNLNVKKVFYFLFFVHIFIPFLSLSLSLSLSFNAYDFRSVINSNLFLISLKINLYEKKLLTKGNGFIGYF
jgi:hypothetical protein